jgi:hypothetical protein
MARIARFVGGWQVAAPRRRLTWSAMAAIAVAAAAVWAVSAPSRACAEASSEPVATAAASDPALGDGLLLPVWALLDGDTPVSGGRVHVYADGPRDHHGLGRRPLRQAGGARSSLTQPSGVALLEFDRLPRRFTVVVMGGQAEGQRLRGALRAQVRAYRSGVVVHVNPVTTLVARWRREDPNVNRARARVTVYRALGIPRWADGIDLRATDRWFDGDTFLERSRGRLDRALSDMLDEIRSGAPVHVRGVASSTADDDEYGHAGDVRGDDCPGAEGACAADEAAGLEEWWKDLDVSQLLIDGFADLGLSVLKQGVEAGGKWLVGKLLDEWGLKDVKNFLLPKSDTEVILEILTSLNKRVAELQGTVESVKNAVAEGQFSQLVALTNPQLAAIDQITEELAIVASLAPEDVTRVNYSKQVVAHIKLQLADTSAARQLHQALDNPAPEANDVLKAASQVYATRRFFTAKSSANIKAVYEYFALYQFRMAVLLTNYWSSEPETFSATTVQRFITGIDTNVAMQKAERLKPPVPGDKFIDTRTMKVWDRTPPWTNGYAFKPVFRCTRTSCGDENVKTDFGSEDDFRDLIDGFKGNSPLEWLQKEVGLVVYTPEPGSGLPVRDRGLVWLGPYPDQAHWLGEKIFRANLAFDDRPGPSVITNILRERDPQNYAAHAMTVHPVAPGVYWWPLGGR